MGFYKSSPITNIAKAICESLFAEKTRLRHVRRPQQGYYMSSESQERQFCRKKTPAARKNTSTGLSHVLKNPGTPFLPTRRRLRHVRRPHQATIHKWPCYFCDGAYSYPIWIVIGHAITESQFSQLAGYSPWCDSWPVEHARVWCRRRHVRLCWYLLACPSTLWMC